MTIFVKLPPNSGHLQITDKFFKIRMCLLFRGFTIKQTGVLDLFQFSCLFSSFLIFSKSSGILVYLLNVATTKYTMPGASGTLVYLTEYCYNEIYDAW